MVYSEFIFCLILKLDISVNPPMIIGLNKSSELTIFFLKGMPRHMIGIEIIGNTIMKQV